MQRASSILCNVHLLWNQRRVLVYTQLVSRICLQSLRCQLWELCESFYTYTRAQLIYGQWLISEPGHYQ